MAVLRFARFRHRWPGVILAVWAANPAAAQSRGATPDLERVKWARAYGYNAIMGETSKSFCGSLYNERGQRCPNVSPAVALSPVQLDWLLGLLQDPKARTDGNAFCWSPHHAFDFSTTRADSSTTLTFAFIVRA
jgi:hypothetical protein